MRCNKCHVCENEINLIRKGSFLKAESRCLECTSSFTWSSQPYISNHPAGNILLSSGILLSGLPVSRVLLLFDHLNISHHSYNSYLIHQKTILFPTVNTIWKSKQAELLQTLQAEGQPLELAGDGRADSPGHSGNSQYVYINR